MTIVCKSNGLYSLGTECVYGQKCNAYSNSIASPCGKIYIIWICRNSSISSFNICCNILTDAIYTLTGTIRPCTKRKYDQAFKCRQILRLVSEISKLEEPLVLLSKFIKETNQFTLEMSSVSCCCCLNRRSMR